LGLVSLGGVDAQFVELVEVGLEEVSDHGGLLVVDDDDSGDEEEVLGVDVVGEWMSYGSDGNVCPPESQTRGESLSIFAVLERRCPSSVFRNSMFNSSSKSIVGTTSGGSAVPEKGENGDIGTEDTC